jgi:hypothetical protein
MTARRRLVLATVLAVSSFACPSQFALSATSTTVEQGHESQVDVNPDETNPCTGAVGDVIDDERDSWTVVTRSDGSTLMRGHSVSRVTFTPYDRAAESYAGEEVFTDVEAVSRGADVAHVSHRLRLHGSAGGTITMTALFRIVVAKDGTVRVARESNALTCG